MKKNLTMLTIVMVLYSCQQINNDLTDAERSNIKVEIEKITNSIFESENQRDAVQLYSNFSDQTTGIINGTIMESWEQHKKYGTDFLSSQKKLQVKIENMTVKVISRDAVVLYGKYTLTATDSTGTTTTTSPAWTYIFAKEKGDWKVINFHVSEQPAK